MRVTSGPRAASYVAQHERSASKLGPRDEKCTPFARSEVLGFVEAQRGELAERAERTTAKLRAERLGRVFDQRHRPEHREEGVEVGGVTRVVDRDDRTRSGPECAFHGSEVQVAVRVDVHEAQ